MKSAIDLLTSRAVQIPWEEHRQMFVEFQCQCREVERLEKIKKQTHSVACKLGWARKRKKQMRDRIVEINTPLVIAMADRFNAHNKEDGISEGLVRLIRCVELFDPEKNVRFSTYVCRALYNIFINVDKTELKHHRNRIEDEHDFGMLCGFYEHHEEDDGLLSDLQDVLKDNKAKLTGIQWQVIQLRFGLRDGKNQTLGDIAQALGLSRERVRQIERDGINKLRVHMTKDVSKMSIEELIQEIDEEGEDLTEWETQFIANLVDNPPASFSIKQVELIKRIHEERVE